MGVGRAPHIQHPHVSPSLCLEARFSQPGFFFIFGQRYLIEGIMRSGLKG
jgi:hypothetical protein